MAYTYDQLVQAYKAVHDGVAPDAATQANFQVQAAMSANGQLSDAQLLGAIINSADGTTALAVLSYQFFTGKSPTAAGLDYLVNSATNTSDLNDAYYSKFSLENRYINFAANLGVQGEGASAFSAKYGSLSFADYVASIYQTIIGGSYAQAAGIDPAAAIASIISRKDAILATATSAGMITPNMTAAQIDIALKAATAGYLLGEAIKADVGLYAAAANNFMAALAQGNAVYNTDITYTYAPSVSSFSHGTGKAVDAAPTTLPSSPTTPTGPTGPVAHAFVLGAGVNRITGGVLNDTFSATDQTFHAGDMLDGAGGNDTLTVTGSGGLFSVPLVTVRNIETATLVNDPGALSADVSGWTGLTRLTVNTQRGSNVTAASTTDVTLASSQALQTNVTVQGGHDVTVNETNAYQGTITIGSVTAPTGAVTINRSNLDDPSPGSITIYGGTSIDVTQTAANLANTTSRAAAIAVNGSALTTSVKAKGFQTVAADTFTVGTTASNVIVNDVNYGTSSRGVITTVDLDGYNSTTIRDTGLTTLKLAHGGNATILNDGATSPATTLNLTVNGVSATQITDTGVYTQLNIGAGATASALGTVGMAGLTTATITGAGGLTADFSGITGLTSVSTTGSTGSSVLTIDPSHTAFTGGAGADTLTLSSNTISNAIALGGGDDTVILATDAFSLGAGLTIDGGAGTGDVLQTGYATFYALSSANVLNGFTNFEVLNLTNISGGGGNIVNLAQMGSLKTVIVNSVNLGASLIFNNFTVGAALVLREAPATHAGYVTLNSPAWVAGTDDTLHVTLESSTPTGQTWNGLTASYIENYVFTTVDKQATPSGAFQDVFVIGGGNAKTIVASGNAGLSLTTLSTGVTSIDASGISQGGFTFSSTGITGAITIDGAATSANAIDVRNATLTYVGGSGVDTLTVGGGHNVLTLGGGNDVVTLAAGTTDPTNATTINDIAHGDSLVFTGVTASAGGPLGAAVTQGGSPTLLDAAAAGAGSAGAALVTWFEQGGSTYVVVDVSAGSTFVAGTDYVVKLVGTGLGLATAMVSGGTLTF